jgi:hypothetical protein
MSDPAQNLRDWIATYKPIRSHNEGIHGRLKSEETDIGNPKHRPAQVQRRPRELVQYGARQCAVEVDAPDLLPPVRKAQAAERDGHLDLVARVRDAARRLVDHVEGGVLALVRHQHVRLHAVRVRAQEERRRRIAIRVQHDGDHVVVPDPAPLTVTGPDRAAGS